MQKIAVLIKQKCKTDFVLKVVLSFLFHCVWGGEGDRVWTRQTITTLVFSSTKIMWLIQLCTMQSSFDRSILSPFSSGIFQLFLCCSGYSPGKTASNIYFHVCLKENYYSSIRQNSNENTIVCILWLENDKSWFINSFGLKSMYNSIFAKPHCIHKSHKHF